MSSSSPAALRVVLAFAASDPTGGAGMQADLLTAAALGCHPLSVITGITVQDTHGVQRLTALDADCVAAQARCVLADIRVAAFKAGVVASSDNARAIAAVLAEHRDVPFVLDPVLASGRGDALATEAMLAPLLSLTTVLTPNSDEARRLASPETDLARCAARLIERGCRYVLVTGTHERGDEVVNTLYDARGVVREDRWPRLPESYHGSGCTLASAIAALLARGATVHDAVREAEEYTWHALAAGLALGGGQPLPNRFWRR